MKSLVVYSSQSGNTRKLAEAVLDALSGEKALYPIDEAPDPSGYGFIAVGFWLMGGKPDPKSSEYLGKIGKNELFIFATHTSTRREVISMPGFDGSGPAGGGPMTGGGRGYCSAGGSYRLGRSWSRRSVGSGFGRGRGYRHMLWETGLPRWARGRSYWSGPGRGSYYSQEDEARMLKKEAETLKEDLDAIERRMNERETGKKPDN